RPVRKATDSQGGAVDRNRTDYRVQARSVRHSGVHHRRALIQTASDSAHDPLADIHGDDGRSHSPPRVLNPAVTFDVNPSRWEHHDVIDVARGHEVSQRPRPKMISSSSSRISSMASARRCSGFNLTFRLCNAHGSRMSTRSAFWTSVSFGFTRTSFLRLFIKGANFCRDFCET